MSAPGSLPPRILVPRWIQLVALPLLLVLAWIVIEATGHVVLLFLIAGMIALLLNPLVRRLGRLGIPRSLSVVMVYLSFIALVLAVLVAIGTIVLSQTKSATERFNAYFTVRHGQTGPTTSADRDVDRLQQWLNDHNLKSIKIDERGHRLVKRIRERDVGRYTHRIVNFVEGAAISIGKAIFAVVLLLVISIYMLLDLPRLGARVDRRFPPRDGVSLINRIEHALASYVRGQILLSLIIGVSAGVGLYVLGVTGLLPGADHYALLFGGWVALTEVLPYLGPWLGAIPPFIYALVVHPISVIWVVLLFLVIHQVEGHIVVPNVMGNALRLHPLLVIFGLLAGTEIYGLIGALIALPMLAAAHAIWEFFAERIDFESWGGGGVIPVEIEPVPPVPVETAASAPPK